MSMIEGAYHTVGHTLSIYTSCKKRTNQYAQIENGDPTPLNYFLKQINKNNNQQKFKKKLKNVKKFFWIIEKVGDRE